MGTKLKILHCLCDFRLDSKKVTEILESSESDSLRIEPLGFDVRSSAYWYFYGTRLYREDHLSAAEKKKRKKNGNEIDTDRIWQVICFTEDDWNNLASKFRNSKNKDERALCKILEKNFLPKIPKLFRDKEHQRRRKLFINRQSTRLKALAEIQSHSKSSSIIPNTTNTTINTNSTVTTTATKLESQQQDNKTNNALEEIVSFEQLIELTNQKKSKSLEKKRRILTKEEEINQLKKLQAKKDRQLRAERR